MAQMIKNLPAMQEIWVLIPGLGRYLGEGNDHPLQYSCLENSMNKRAWWVTILGVAQLYRTGQQTLYPFDRTMK